MTYLEKLESENVRLRAALQDVKALVCGDRVPHWVDDALAATRGKIADICDMALGR